MTDDDFQAVELPLITSLVEDSKGLWLQYGTRRYRLLTLGFTDEVSLSCNDRITLSRAITYDTPVAIRRLSKGYVPLETLAQASTRLPWGDLDI